MSHNRFSPEHYYAFIERYPKLKDGTNYLYVVEISHSLTKIGITTKPYDRLSSHRTTAAAFDHRVGRIWISRPHPTDRARIKRTNIDDVGRWRRVVEVALFSGHVPSQKVGRWLRGRSFRLLSATTVFEIGT